ncbi:MAG: nucleoside kinase [Eubacterium sp.]|nr:nucleoside kinase [Eubacterium sp.]
MDKKAVVCRFEGKAYTFESGTTYDRIVKSIAPSEADRILLVSASGRLRELHKHCRTDCTIVPVCRDSSIGFDTYRRSANFLFLKALYDVSGKDMSMKAILEFNIGNGLYYEVPNAPKEKNGNLKGINADNQAVGRGFIEKIKARMLELRDRNLPIHKQAVSTHRAIEYFKSMEMQDKVELFRFRRSSNMNIYSLEDYSDYFYGYMVLSTGYIRDFDLIGYGRGLILVLPPKDDPYVMKEFKPSPKLFETQKKSEHRGIRLGVNSVGQLNDCVCRQGMNHQILMDESYQEGTISDIAGEIIRRKNVKLVLIAGPSSSGKTTFSRRLSIQLASRGFKPHPLSLDNYYRNRSECPRDKDGNYDFECLEALDLELLERDLTDMIAGKEVQIPSFSFIKGQREYHGNTIQLKDGDILIMEGIHGLNERISSFLPPECKYRIYISALTQLNLDDHNPISTTDGRLIRRIVRDYRTRGTSAEETIRMWPSVKRGEHNYIFPFQENADIIFNSALNYELSVLKTYAEPLLFQIDEEKPEYQEAKRLLKFLSYFLAVPSDLVPGNSILREFIGGSVFSV